MYSYINYYSQDTRERENRDRKQCIEMKEMQLQRASDCCREVDFFFGNGKERSTIEDRAVENSQV